jgi:hypothetical protein
LLFPHGHGRGHHHGHDGNGDYESRHRVPIFRVAQPCSALTR